MNRRNIKEGFNELDGSAYVLSISFLLFIVLLFAAMCGCTLVKYPVDDNRSAVYITWLQDRHLTVSKDQTKTTIEYSTDNDPAVKVAEITAKAVVDGIKEGRKESDNRPDAEVIE